MPFVPAFDKWVGILPLQEAAKAIIEDNFTAALAWRCALDGSTPGSDYARIQFMQRHSADYPLLIIQAATETPLPLGTGGIQQAMIFDCEIFITKAITSGSLGEQTDELARETVRYLDATRMAFLSAADSEWLAEFPAGADAGKLKVWCSNVVFGQLEQSREVNGVYLHSVAFELQIRFIEAQ
jgi:hypothetical protein